MRLHCDGKLTGVLALFLLLLTPLSAALAQPPATNKMDYKPLGWLLGYITDYDNGFPLASQVPAAGGNGGEAPQGPWQDRALPPFGETIDGAYEDYQGLGLLEVWNCGTGHDTAGFTVSVNCGLPRYDLYLPLIIKGASMKR